MNPGEGVVYAKGTWLSRSVSPAVLAAASVCALGLTAFASPAVAESQTLGFLISRFAPAIYKGENSCPNGLALTPLQSFTKQTPAAEMARLQKPENATEFERRYKWDFGTGPNGEEMCKVPDTFVNQYEHPAQYMIQGTTSYGMNLDGHDGTGPAPEGICAHENFKSPTGETGIDNQLFRAEGCLGYYRGSATDPSIEGAIIAYYNRILNEGLHSIVIEISGVDDLKNDDDVTFGIYTSPDKGYLVGKKLMPHMTYTTTDKEKWRHEVPAKIVNGVIKTKTFDLLLNMEWAIGGDKGAHQEYEMRQALFEWELLPDGSLKGLMGAYQDIYNVYSLFRSVGSGVSAVASVDCAAEYKALQLMADAYPDPKTGKCSAVSLAYEVQAVPGFIVHPKGFQSGNGKKVAMSGSRDQ